MLSFHPDEYVHGCTLYGNQDQSVIDLFSAFTRTEPDPAVWVGYTVKLTLHGRIIEGNVDAHSLWQQKEATVRSSGEGMPPGLRLGVLRWDCPAAARKKKGHV